MTSPRLPVTGDPDADALIDADPFALLLGMLLDQQVEKTRNAAARDHPR
jgi:hypothetical protein